MMSDYTMIIHGALCVGALCGRCLGQTSSSAGGAAYPDPTRFEGDVRKFELADKEQPPPHGAIVCIGSSSMRGWHETIRADLAPLTVLPRGFGGSNMNDALHYADRIVLPYKPRAIVLYEGDNDIAQGVAPGAVLQTFRLFVDKVCKELPECRIYVLSVKPSIARWNLWPKMKQTNEMLAAECTKNKHLTFVDVASGMLNSEGVPRPELFGKDKLHMTRDGYKVWRDALKPVLLKAELKCEG